MVAVCLKDHVYNREETPHQKNTAFYDTITYNLGPETTDSK